MAADELTIEFQLPVYPLRVWPNTHRPGRTSRTLCTFFSQSGRLELSAAPVTTKRETLHALERPETPGTAFFVVWFKTRKRLKERFLIIRNRTKRANFRCNHLFRATYNRT